MIYLKQNGTAIDFMIQIKLVTNRI